LKFGSHIESEFSLQSCSFFLKKKNGNFNFFYCKQSVVNFISHNKQLVSQECVIQYLEREFFLLNYCWVAFSILNIKILNMEANI
jgi:hypothetical protein